MNGSQSSHRNDKVQLGCGTLILIALIVIIFSGGGETRNLENEIQGLKKEVHQLREAVEALTAINSTNTTNPPSIEAGVGSQR